MMGVYLYVGEGRLYDGVYLSVGEGRLYDGSIFVCR